LIAESYQIPVHVFVGFVQFVGDRFSTYRG